MKHLEIKLCNCTGCGKELLGESCSWWASLLPADKRQKFPPSVRGRILGRPYCRDCLESPRPAPKAVTKDDESPWQANAIRDMEEG